MKKRKDFVRLQSNGEFVEGSNVKRYERPVKGDWYEIHHPTCCEVTVAAGTPGGNTVTIVEVLCGTSTLAKLSVASTNMLVVADALNQNLPSLGKFTATSTSLTFRTNLCEFADLKITYASAAQALTTSSTSSSSTSSSSSSSSSSSTTSSSTSTSTTTT